MSEIRVSGIAKPGRFGVFWPSAFVILLVLAPLTIVSLGVAVMASEGGGASAPARTSLVIMSWPLGALFALMAAAGLRLAGKPRAAAWSLTACLFWLVAAAAVFALPSGLGQAVWSFLIGRGG